MEMSTDTNMWSHEFMVAYVDGAKTSVECLAVKYS